MSTVNCTVFKETEKAYMFRVNGSTDCFWISKFALHNNSIKIQGKKAKIPHELLTRYSNKDGYKPTKKEETKQETKPSVFDIVIYAESGGVLLEITTNEVVNCFTVKEFVQKTLAVTDAKTSKLKVVNKTTSTYWYV